MTKKVSARRQRIKLLAIKVMLERAKARKEQAIRVLKQHKPDIDLDHTSHASPRLPSKHRLFNNLREAMVILRTRRVSDL